MTTTDKSRADALTDERAAAIYAAAAASITGRPTFEQWCAALVRAILAAPPVEQHEAAPAEELREAARQFHNLTQGDSTVIIRAPSAEKRDAITAAGERLRAALSASKSAPLEGTGNGTDNQAIAECCARFAELYRDKHASSRDAIEACATACRDYAVEHAARAPSADAAAAPADERAAFDTRACAESLNSMITEWVDSCLRIGVKWHGMTDVIEKRLARFTARAAASQPAAVPEKCAGCVKHCTNSPADCYTAPPAQEVRDGLVNRI